MFSGGIERNQWHEMALSNVLIIACEKYSLFYRVYQKHAYAKTM